MQKEQLENTVTDATRIVDERKSVVSRIQTQQNAADLALTRARKEREKHALPASLGDPSAIAALKSARDAQREAEQMLDDLRVALPAAEASLTEAEKAAVSAKAALARFIAEGKMREVIDEDVQIDIVAADLTRRLEKRAKLITEVINMDVLPRSLAGMINYEEAMGMRRVAAALPFLPKIHPNMPRDEIPKLPLAVSDRRYFGLATEPATTKAA